MQRLPTLAQQLMGIDARSPFLLSPEPHPLNVDLLLFSWKSNSNTACLYVSACLEVGLVCVPCCRFSHLFSWSIILSQDEILN